MIPGVEETPATIDAASRGWRRRARSCRRTSSRASSTTSSRRSATSPSSSTARWSSSRWSTPSTAASYEVVLPERRAGHPGRQPDHRASRTTRSSSSRCRARRARARTSPATATTPASSRAAAPTRSRPAPARVTPARASATPPAPAAARARPRPRRGPTSRTSPATRSPPNLNSAATGRPGRADDAPDQEAGARVRADRGPVRGLDGDRRVHPLEPALLPARLVPARSGTDFYEVEAELSTAQAVVPGQGQTVNIAGVKVGEVGEVKLEDGRAVVTMQIQDQYKPIYQDATILLRPKTGLKDMILALDPGTESGGRDRGGRPRHRPPTRCPDVNPDEVLASLDGDTRAYLRILLNAGGTAFRDEPYSQASRRAAQDLRETFKRFEPTARDSEKHHEAADQAAQEHPPRDPQLPGARPRRSARRTSSSPRSWTPRTRTSRRSPQEEDNLREALQLFPGALRRPTTTLAAHGLAREGARARRSRGCGRSRASWRRRCAASARSCATPRRSSATRSARSRATCSPP